MIKVAPSILAADFSDLKSGIRTIEDAGADYVHVDVMDGIFVPNITIGIPVAASLRKVTDLPLDVHLMIDRPLRYVSRFLEAGADILNVHAEADFTENTLTCLRLIQDAGKIPAVTLKPGTPAEAVLPFLEHCGLILVMTVEPGFGGQSFMPHMLPKITKIRQWINAKNPGCLLEVDGGINPVTGAEAVRAGADVLVAGSAFFKAENKRAFTSDLQSLSPV